MYALKSIAIAAIAIAATQFASAAKINGEIAFDGTVNLNGSTQTATAFTSFTNVKVATDTQTADYVGLDGLDTSMTGFSFAPFSGPVNTLWEVVDGLSTYSFVLEQLTGVSRFTIGSQNFLVVSGTGTASATGFEDAKGSWSLTTQSGSSKSTLSFSSATDVPDTGATALLLGLGLVGLASARRLRAGK